MLEIDSYKFKYFRLVNEIVTVGKHTVTRYYVYLLNILL